MATGEIPTTAHAMRRLPARAWCLAVGKAAELKLPPPLLKAAIVVYKSALRVELSEAAVPASGFRTFGEFFTRRLRPGVRRVDRAEGALASPCDGLVTAAGALVAGGAAATFEVKGRAYSTEDLVGRLPSWLEGGAGGSYAVLYLSPADYHRVHSPSDGLVTGVRRIPGTRAPVNRLGAWLAPAAVVTNERVVIEVEGDDGPVVVVMVGALGVSSIDVTVPGLAQNGQAAVPVWKGDEIGVFNLGSTVVVLWAGTAVPVVRPGQRVTMGQRLAADRP